MISAFGLGFQHHQLALIVLCQLAEDLPLHFRKKHETELLQTSKVRSVSECSKKAQLPATAEAVRTCQGKLQEEGNTYRRSRRTAFPGDW